VSLAILARAVLVALIAAACSATLMIVLLTWDMDSGLGLSLVPGFLVIALVGNLLIGLPIALLTYWCIRGRQDLGLWHLIGLANLVTCVFLSVLATGGAFGLIFYGIPIAVSANVFAIAGWLIVVGPMRAKT
jgi:hypothetical protein